MIREDDLSTLMDLGLTLLEAKAYFALSTTGTATIGTISRIACIAKQDMYRIMPRLQALGLVERIVAPQATYKAVPLENGISTLLQSKAEVYASLQEKATKLISNFKNFDPIRPLEGENPHFRIISEKSLLLRTLDTITESTRESIDIAHYWQFTKGMLFNHGSGILEKAMKRGVRIRWITENHCDRKAEEKLGSLTRYPLFEIRYVQPPIPVRIAVYDWQEALMGIAYRREDWASSLLSNNKVFVEVLTSYYEQLWNYASASNSDKPAPMSVPFNRFRKSEIAVEALATHLTRGG